MELVMPVSSDTPFWYGPRQAAQSPPKAEPTESRLASQNPPRTGESITVGDSTEKDVLWTDLSPRQIADAATDMGTPVSPPVVQDWMKEQKLGRHKIEKVLAGGQSPDRDAQFLQIAKLKAKKLWLFRF